MKKKEDLLDLYEMLMDIEDAIWKLDKMAKEAGELSKKLSLNFGPIIEAHLINPLDRYVEKASSWMLRETENTVANS